MDECSTVKELQGGYVSWSAIAKLRYAFLLLKSKITKIDYCICVRTKNSWLLIAFLLCKVEKLERGNSILKTEELLILNRPKLQFTRH